MICSRCGNQNQDNARFCSYCGIPSVIYAQTSMAQLPPAPVYSQVPMPSFSQPFVYPQMQVSALPSKKSSKKKWLLGIAGFFVFAAIIGNIAEERGIKGAAVMEPETPSHEPIQQTENDTQTKE